MISYRITKFNPSKRDVQGYYLDDSEWTAISDIGKSKYNNITYEEYEKIETAYVEAIMLILREKNIESLKVAALEASYYDIETFEEDKRSGRLRNIEVDYHQQVATLKNGKILNLAEIPTIIRLILRECIWMELLTTDFKLTFGYDYYMYVKCYDLKDSTIRETEKINLFVEQYS